jgi:hypothetical protein
MQEDKGVTLEVRNSKGEVVQERELTEQEVEVLPDLMKVRQLIEEGSASLALEKLVELVGKTQGSQAVHSIMERGRQEYKRLQEQEEEEEAKRQAGEVCFGPLR